MGCLGTLSKNRKMREPILLLYKKILFVLMVIIFFICELCTLDRVSMGNGYYFYKERKDILGDKINGIPPVVEHYWKNHRYIIVRQRPKWPPEAIYGTVDYPYGYGMDYYWVVDKADDSVQGPLDSATFYRYIHMKNIDYKLER